MNLQDLLDPILDPLQKGIPHHAPPLRRSEIGSQGWNVLRGDLPLPLAVIRRDALAGNLRWMQDFAAGQGVGLIHDIKPVTAIIEDLVREYWDTRQKLQP